MIKVHKTYKIKYFDKPLYRTQGDIEWNKFSKFYQFICTQRKTLKKCQNNLQRIL